MEDCSTDERLRQETLCRRQRTDKYVEHPDSRVVDKAERNRRLDSVSAGRRNSVRRYVGARPCWHCTPRYASCSSSRKKHKSRSQKVAFMTLLAAWRLDGIINVNL